MDTLISGCALLLGVLLVSAGIPKVLAPRYAGSAIRRVIGRSRMPSDGVVLAGTRFLGGCEVLLGVALVFSRGMAAVIAAAAASAIFAAFTAFVAAAVRRGANCGCWASLSEGPAGGAELGRSMALTVLAGFLLLEGAAREKSTSIDGPALSAAVGWFGVVVAAGAAGGVVGPVTSERVARQLHDQAPRSTIGRVGAWLGFQAGFLHAGTDAGRRRYALARIGSGTDRTISDTENGRRTTWLENPT